MRFLKKKHQFNSMVLVLVFSIITAYGYAQDKKTYWDNGNLKTTTNYDEDGNKTGYWKTYYQNGELKEYGYYENGKKSGIWSEYYFGRTRKKTTHYSDGLMTAMEVFYESGRRMVIGNFDTDEKKHGVWQQFYDNWQEKLTGEYSHGKKHGQWKYYTENGKLFKIENYKAGVRTSKWEGDNENSNEYAREEFAVDASEEIVEVEGEEITEYVEVEGGGIEAVVEDAAHAVEDAGNAVEDAADATVEARSYFGNRLNGEWKFYNEKGEVIEIGNYKDDKKDGKWTYYYGNGQIKKVQLWKEGKLMEVLSYFDKKGDPFDKGTLKYGIGTVKEYDADNKLISTIEYIYGEKLDWNNSDNLNNLAWDVYENESDGKALQKAIKWVKRSIELEKNYYNTDTYAALLYKTGKYKQALAVAEKAITIAKKSGDKFKATEDLIEKINMNLNSEK